MTATIFEDIFSWDDESYCQTTLRWEEQAANETYEAFYTQRPSAGLRAGGGENRLNVIRQRMPPANSNPEAGTRSYTLLIAMLLS